MMLKNRFEQRLSGRRLQRGQGMTEYIIIVALVAIAAIAVYSFFGQAVRGQMASITGQLAGSSGTIGLGAANTAHTNANVQGKTTYNLKTYNQGAVTIKQ